MLTQPSDADSWWNYMASFLGICTARCLQRALRLVPCLGALSEPLRRRQHDFFLVIQPGAGAGDGACG